ncbi:DivIVA domain-containing protein [Ruania suaedae]|uniref:DivIVA domain-containing protein n=1 Tax=Ruania suaedae TaxID=2897774 RepID=UPI001E30E37E|nr:DivIVA domain-containing protein [Ruania suaedae]UFU04165.1 DivIVA domain-containing protein [Ruania suaedae]
MEGLFPTVKGWSTGYDQDEVEDFFADARASYEGAEGGDVCAQDVRQVAFDLVRGGFEPAAVDAALDRLEGAFVQRERADFIASRGQEAWMEQVADRATTLYPRLVRPAGERFAPPERGRGYSAAAVDAVMDRLVAYFDSGHVLTAAELRHVTFPRASRSRSYAEGPVDAFLDRAVDVLLAVE